MPPKSGKKKLSKAEKERLKKEEAERKLREEEEARIQAEKDEASRKEREKEEAEERRRLENEQRQEREALEFAERKKRKGQLQELDELWDSNRNTLLEEMADKRRKDKWARYMRCDGSPDPSIPGEINTYINLWREDQERVDIQTVLEDSDLCLSLMDELVDTTDLTPPEELTDKLSAQYKETLTDLQLLLQEKVDLASHDLFLKATELQNSETLNLQEVIRHADITLCVWGNLSKNPRIKSHTFEETGFTFEIPRVLTLSDCGVRALFTLYDHFSEHSVSYEPRCKKPPSVLPEEEPPVIEDAKPEEEEKEQEEEGVGREETQDVMAALNALDDDEEETEVVQEETPEEEEMEEDIEIKTPEPVEFEDFDGDEDAIDLRANQVLGGVFFFNLISLPPQPRTVKDWVITQMIVPPALHYTDYVADSAPTTQSPDAKKTDDSNKEKKEVDKPAIGVTLSSPGADVDNGTDVPSVKVQAHTPIQITYRLPEQVYFSEEPQIVRWDYDQKVWSLEGFSEHKFEEEKRLLSFKTSQFGTMALVQDTHINMPFQSWELRPRGSNQAQLTIIAAIVEVDIQIKDDMCCLSAPDDKPELQHIINQWYPVHTFIKKMNEAGLNLFPSCDSTKYVSIQNKNLVTEDRMYQQMSLVASSMAFSWSKWNSEVPEPAKEKIVIQVAEHLVDEPLMEEDWSIWMVTKKRTTKLKMTEFDETFSDDHAEGTEFNADMYHMTMELASEDAKERIRETNHKFVNSVYTMLNSTKLLTYS